MKQLFFLVGFCLTSCVFGSEAIRVNSVRDYTVLDQFFRTMITSEEYGYVLEGTKPISIRLCDSLSNLNITKNLASTEKEFNTTLLIHDALPIWNQLCAHQNKFVLKAVTLENKETPFPDLELLFINVSKLEQVIEKDINLFRYILGPTLTTQQITDQIVNSTESLMDSLQYNFTLIGIVLGFDTHNSLMGGRVETILAHSISRDAAPFTPQSILMQREGNHSLNFLTAERYGSYYLAQAAGEDGYFRKSSPRLCPNKGFLLLDDEIGAIDALSEPLPVSLAENPKFIFGAYKGGPSNQTLFNSLQLTQKKIQNLLKSSKFLEKVLEKISGKKPIIIINKSRLKDKSIPSSLSAKSWVQIIWEATERFEGKARKLTFLDAFCHPLPSCREPPSMMGASAATLEGLSIARTNLQVAEDHFQVLSKEPLWEMIIPEKLYFKTESSGTGKKLEREGSVRIGYTMENINGDILFAHHDTWINLLEIIPGFAHGIQGMRIGEKRTLFVHPVFAYGALTTLPLCTALKIKVHLKDIDPTSQARLPTLTPINLSWLQEPSLYHSMVESLKQQPRYIGSFYRDILERMNSSDQEVVIDKVNELITKMQ